MCHILSVHSPADETLGVFSPEFWVFTKKAVTRTYVQVFWAPMFAFLLGRYWRVELLGECMFNILKKTLSSSPKWLYNFCSQQQDRSVSVATRAHQHLVLLIAF